KEIAENLRERMKKDVIKLNEQGIHPHLTVIIIGDDPASHSYMRGKEKASKQVGIQSEIIQKETTITEEALLQEIKSLIETSHVHGILVQVALPDHIDEQKVIEAIGPTKDVDVCHPINDGKMMTNQDTFYPCTPFGIVHMLKEKEIPIEGQHVVIIGR